MKNSIFTLLILAFSQVSMAQDNDFRERINLGAKIGMNLSNVYNSSGEQFVADNKFGLAFGAFATLPIGLTFALQPEVLLSQKGFKSTGRILGSNYTLSRTSTYLDVPVLIAFRPTSFISILAGPQYSYLVNQKDVFENNGNTTILQEQEFKNDNIRKNILSVTGGVDINIKNLVLSARAGWDIQKNRGDGTSTTPQYKNLWYQATIGLRLF